MQQMPPRPVPVIGLSTHLADAQEAAEDLTAALQDALRAGTTDEQTALVITLLEMNAQLAARLCQLRAVGAR